MPKVFISSTSDDLAQYREAVRDAVLDAGLLPVMMEYFNAQGKAVPYKACMAKVADCDILIVLAAHRYGWVPPDQPGPKAKRTRSITWLECLEAQKRKPPTEILTFLVDETIPWPPQSMEASRLSLGAPVAEVTRNLTQLQAFKTWLSGLGFRKTFTSPADLKAKVASALGDWRTNRKAPTRSRKPTARRSDPTAYLAWLRESCAWIDIRGLQVGSTRAHRFPIDDLYIPLNTSTGARRGREIEQPATVPLEESLKNPRLVIVGDPGSGKTTFLRRIAFELGRPGPASPQKRLKLPFKAFPLLIRIAELERHIEKNLSQHLTPNTRHSPAWLPHFLAARAHECQWDLDDRFFEGKLETNSTILLLDGLDEAPSRARREDMARLIENAASAYYQCRFAVTTRSATYLGRATLSGFHKVRLGDLRDDAAEGFLSRWSNCLFPGDHLRAEAHLAELMTAIQSRDAFRTILRTPLMLSVLAVVHWNERRLPEQRADLYESILTWLARTREQRPGRESPDRCLELLAALALGMQNHPTGCAVAIEKGPAASILQPLFHELPESDRLRRAERFLDEEEVDSCIILSHGSTLSFLHKSLQEYLAARAAAGLSNESKWERLFDKEKLYSPEWREFVLLLAGILIRQGHASVDGLISLVLQNDTSRSDAALATRLILLDTIVSDLQPYGYRPSSDQKLEASRILLAIANSGLQNLNLHLRIELLGAAIRLELGTPELMQLLAIPVSTLLDRALRDPVATTRELAILELLTIHFKDQAVLENLVHIATENINRPFRWRIERAFESAFPIWKRWLVGMDDVSPIPDFFRNQTVPLSVRRFRLRNIKAFQDTGTVAVRPGTSLFVGENTSGKSTLLRAIALASLGPAMANQLRVRPLSYLRHGAVQGSIEVGFAIASDDNPHAEFVVGLGIREGETAFRALDAADMTLALHNCADRIDLLRRRTDDKLGFVCAYGSFRTFADPTPSGPPKEEVALDRVASLFHPHAAVIDPELMTELLSGQLARLRGAPPEFPDALRTIMQSHLRQTLPQCSFCHGDPPDKIPLHGDSIGLHDLSDGYSSLTALIGHLFRYALASSGWREDPASVAGVVLIDEIDAHLHPSWQRRVLPDLARLFRNLQILATTHSALVAASVETQSVIHLSTSRPAHSVQVRRYDMDLQGLDANDILTGPMFGLDDTRDIGTEVAELRYYELRKLPTPTQQELAEREVLAKRLFGHRTEYSAADSKEILDAIRTSLYERLQATTPQEKALRLAEAEAMIEMMLTRR